MFGYVLPEKSELKIKEYNVFRAYYCGLCKSIAKRCGQLSRLVLNYDCTFLALFLCSMDEKSDFFSGERCIAHPVNKRLTARMNPFIDYASDINIILAYFSLKDNWQDDKSIPSAAGMLVLYKAFRKCRARIPEKCGIIENYLHELAIVERQKCASMDRAAEPFARLMEEILCCKPLLDNESVESAVRWAGYNMGKWIYILDAYNDIEKDLKKGSYNPLIYQYAYKPEESIESLRRRIKEEVGFNLTYSLSELARAFELLEIKKNRGILDNIIYLGTLRKMEQILDKGSCKNNEKSV